MKNPDIVFLQYQPVIYFGILSLTSFLKHKGYNPELLIYTLEKDIVNSLKETNPKLIGITAMSTEHKWVVEISKRIKAYLPDKKIIVGGVHAILYPDVILKEASVDIVCNSEGEHVLLNVMEESQKANPDYSKIPGIVYKDNADTIVANERAQLVSYDSQVVEDKFVYWKKYPILAKDRIHRFISSRGCPYNCSFCYNHNIKDIFRGKGKYVRQKGPDNLIEEIKLEMKEYKIHSIYFFDDLFTFNKNWLKDFLKKYKAEIVLPFMCTTRADTIDEETAQLLSSAGCITCTYGVETGDYLLRRDVLKKDITDERIVECGNLLAKYGISPQSSNIFCLPGETVNIALKSIELNIKAKTKYAFSSIYLPFPETELTNYCIKNGYLSSDYSFENMPTSFLKGSILQIADKDILINVQRLIFLFVRYPFLYKLCRKLVFLKCFKPVYYLFFLLGNLIRIIEGNGNAIISSIIYSWRLRKSL